MKSKMKKALSCIVAVAIIVAMIPGYSTPVFAAEGPAVDLGSATFSTDDNYHYASAAVAGTGIKTILISFSDSVAAGDEIILPSAPTGFHVSSSSESNDYAKRINLDDGVTAASVQDYLRGVSFTIAGSSQSVEVTVTTENIEFDTYYNTNTGHYYQYIPTTTTSWTDAYSTAESMTYMGRTGYLATITSLDEDNFVNDLSGGKTGWLGGTILSNSAITVNSLYYSGFHTGSVVSTGWYWACGPEIGNTFYNTNSLAPGGANSSNASAVDATNSTYFNWARGNISYEPNNTAGNENCLTTLAVTISGQTNYGKHGTTFAWNDIDYDGLGSDVWNPKGYFVEYGNQATGDSGSGSSSFASDGGTLTDLSEITLTTVSWESASEYSCDVQLPASSKMVTISVDSGYFNVPASWSSALTFLGGTSGTSYLGACDTSIQFSSAVFSFADVSSAEDVLDDILYTLDSSDEQTITAISSSVSPEDSDIYFDGHFYRYVNCGTNSIDWPSAVSYAGITADPYFGGRGYIATATNQAENSILLRLVESGSADDGYDNAWMGGLWQRNAGTNAAPVVERDSDGNEINYDDLIYFIENDTVQSVLLDYSKQSYGLSLGDTSTYIYNNPDTVKYYWIDGPEAGDELQNNTDEFAPWHVTSGMQDEPNSGDFVYIGWQGAYWDDFSAYPDDSGSTYDKRDGYIVEFSGFDGGSTEGIIKEDTKTVETTAPVLAAGSVSRSGDSSATVKFTSSEAGSYYYQVVDDNTTAPAIDTGGSGSSCIAGETTVALTTLSAGAKDFYVKAKDTSGNVSNLLKIDIPAYTSSGNGSHHDQASVSTGEDAPVIVNGTVYSAGDAQDSTENGKTLKTVTVDTDKLQKVLDSQGENPAVIVPVSGNSEIASGILTGKMISDMEDRGATLSLRTDSVTYTLPAKEINIDAISEQLGVNVALSDIVVDMRISEPSDSTVSVVENAAKDGGFTIQIPAIDFDITCTYNGKTVKAKVFNVYVQRTVLIPDGVDPKKITTGVVIKPDGTSYHVPTQVKVIDGKYYAVINSLTNSTYTVVWHPVEFADAANHWAKAAINDMGSRMIVNGVSDGIFEPGRYITRAEFAAIMVRALGLDTGMGENSFSDIKSSDWYSGYIGTAVEYGIIKGYGNGTFGPKDSITREQAMTMITRAMSVTGLEYDQKAAQQTLTAFTDSVKTAGWAKDSVAACIQAGLVTGRTSDTIAPQDPISRAEVAVIVQRLLEKSDLI